VADSNNTVICNVDTELAQLNETITDESLVYGDAISITFNNINNGTITMDSRLNIFFSIWVKVSSFVLKFREKVKKQM
jgi:hypothetical protein